MTGPIAGLVKAGLFLVAWHLNGIPAQASICAGLAAVTLVRID